MYPSIESTVGEIIRTAWNITNGNKVPETEDVVLKNGGKEVIVTSYEHLRAAAHGEAGTHIVRE